MMTQCGYHGAVAVSGASTTFLDVTFIWLSFQTLDPEILPIKNGITT